MSELYSWIGNLTAYFLFMSVLDNLLPGKKYTRYLRLFAGMVLILLVLQPLTVSLRLEERIAHYYEAFVFQNQADDLKQELLGVESQRLEQLIGQYEAAVEQDVVMMAEDAGYVADSCRVEIGRKQGSESFGRVTGIQIAVGVAGEDAEEAVQAGAAAKSEKPEYTEQAEHTEEPEYTEKTVRPVEPVRIGNLAELQKAGENEQSAQADSQIASGAEARELRRKIASYYNLEETYVEVQVMEGKR